MRAVVTLQSIDWTVRFHEASTRNSCFYWRIALIVTLRSDGMNDTLCHSSGSGNAAVSGHITTTKYGCRRIPLFTAQTFSLCGRRSCSHSDTASSHRFQSRVTKLLFSKLRCLTYFCNYSAFYCPIVAVYPVIPPSINLRLMLFTVDTRIIIHTLQ